MVYEGYGPHGIAFLVETATDNTTRTVANVRSYFTKCGGTLGTSGSVEFMFDRKCFFRFAYKPDMDLEELELEMIDYGGEEIFRDEEEDVVVIYADFTAYGQLQKWVEEKGFELKSAGFERIVNGELKEINDEQRATIEKLIERLEEDDDVQNVYTNMA